MKRVSRPIFLALVALSFVGCADLSVKKVSLKRRLEGRDGCVDGFRYYLPRPHFVVTKSVTVDFEFHVGTLGCFEKSGPAPAQVVVLAVPSPDGRVDYYDSRGEIIPVERGVHVFTPLMAKTAGGGMSSLPQNRIVPANMQAPVFGEDSLPTASPFSLADQLKDADGSAVAAIEVVMLPDFEHQMAIQDRNFAAKSKFSLDFEQGWQLKSVKGRFDSTDVPVRALQVLANAIGARADVKAEELQAAGRANQGAGSQDAAPQPIETKRAGEVMRGVLVRRQFIPPGMYRMMKAKEIPPNCQSPCGYLSELGLPTESEVSLYRLKSE